MSFKTEVEDITLEVNDTTALDQWLKDGAWDIINRGKFTDPSKLQSFAQQKDISNNTAVVGGNLLLGVYSSEATYREIPPALKIKALDSGSIHKATLTNPVYWKENGSIYLRPTGGSSNTMSIIEIDTVNLANNKSRSDLLHFPQDMMHLLVTYASMRHIQYLIKAKTLPLDSDINLDDVKLPVMPVTFTATNNVNTWDGSAQSRVIIDNTTLAPAPIYEKPVMEQRVSFKDYVSGFDHLSSDPENLVINVKAPSVPILNSITIDSSGWTQPSFVPPIFDNPDWANTNKWIEDEEDPEMLAARVQEISAKAAEFSSLLQEAKMRFDKENTIFQSQIQESLQNAQLAGGKEGQELQKFATEQSDYQAQVSKDISQYTQKLSRYSTEMQTALTSWSKEESDKVNRFSNELQNNLNEFNEDNAEYQAKLQIAIENARLSSAGDGILMQRYANDLQTYQAEVASKVQEYSARVQARTLEYQWLQEQYVRLQNEYEKGFVPFQQPKEQKD